MNKALLMSLLFCGMSLSAYSQDVEPSPLQKKGYRLVWHDEFGGPKIDQTKWVPEYLPSWKKDRSTAVPNYKVENGIIKIIIDKNDGGEKDMIISGFMSGSRSGLHRYSPSIKVLSQVKTEAPNINQYGYYEMRAKTQRGGGVHSAWWLIGFEDDTTKSCEMDIFEILGTDKNTIWSTFHPWRDKSQTYKTMHPNFNNRQLDEEFHIYGFEWTPDSIFVYVDGVQTYAHSAKISYPLIQILSFYDNRSAKDSWTGTYDPSVPYPKTFEIDYVRLYKKIPAGYEPVTDDKLAIVSIEPARLEVIIDKDKAAKTTSLMRNIDGHITPEIYGTPSYVNVKYNDGTVTQQFVEWSAVDKSVEERLKKGETVIVDGEITSLPSSLLKNHKASLFLTGIVVK